MSASPLIVTYNLKDTSLWNYFVDASGSPLPGTSAAKLFTSQSPNFNVQGATLTLQIYDNLVTPLAGAKTSLYVKNFTLIASSATNTLGTLSWSQQYQNPVTGTDPLLTRTLVAKLSSYISSASGIFTNYLFGNVIMQYNITSGDRTINIYSAE